MLLIERNKLHDRFLFQKRLIGYLKQYRIAVFQRDKAKFDRIALSPFGMSIHNRCKAIFLCKCGNIGILGDHHSSFQVLRRNGFQGTADQTFAIHFSQKFVFTEALGITCSKNNAANMHIHTTFLESVPLLVYPFHSKTVNKKESSLEKIIPKSLFIKVSLWYNQY